MIAQRPEKRVFMVAAEADDRRLHFPAELQNSLQAAPHQLHRVVRRLHAVGAILPIKIRRAAMPTKNSAITGPISTSP